MDARCLAGVVLRRKPELRDLDFLPTGIDMVAAVLLVVATFGGALITGAMGIGGGVVLLAVMANLMPAPAIIPIHGVVQLGANVARATIQRAHIDWRTFVWFAAGSVVGIAIGGSVVVTLPTDILRGGLAFFILYTVWGPKLRVVSDGYFVVSLIGLVASFLTMFFGATGVFISGLLSQRGYAARALVGTHSVCMGIQHALKIVVFGILGFAFSEWLWLIAAMMLAGVIGTYAGSQVLHRLPEKTFAIGLKWLLTFLALNLLAVALGLYSIT